MRSAGAIGLLCLFGGCAHAPRGEPLPGSAEALYVQAVEDLGEHLYPEANRSLGEIKAKYPYSRYAALAELRQGEGQMARGSFLEAVESYRGFLKYHPNHIDAPYAALQVGEAFFAQLPEDWWFLPPSAEKDQQSTQRAIGAYEEMLARFGDSPLAGRARTQLAACRRRLADHEMYVAQFYLRRGHPRAAAQRADHLLTQFAGLGLDDEALWIAGRCRAQLGERALARPLLERLRAEHPRSARAAAAARLLGRLGSVPTPPQ